jgi:hypothetical protein
MRKEHRTFRIDPELLKRAQKRAKKAHQKIWSIEKKYGGK